MFTGMRSKRTAAVLLCIVTVDRFSTIKEILIFLVVLKDVLDTRGVCGKDSTSDAPQRYCITDPVQDLGFITEYVNPERIISGPVAFSPPECDRVKHIVTRGAPILRSTSVGYVRHSERHLVIREERNGIHWGLVIPFTFDLSNDGSIEKVRQHHLTLLSRSAEIHPVDLPDHLVELSPGKSVLELVRLPIFIKLLALLDSPKLSGEILHQRHRGSVPVVRAHRLGVHHGELDGVLVKVRHGVTGRATVKGLEDAEHVVTDELLGVPGDVSAVFTVDGRRK